MTGEGRVSGSIPSVSDARLACVLDTAVDGVVVIDEQATILMFNKACERMFGYDASEVVGRNVSILMPQEHAARHDTYLAAYRRILRRTAMGVRRQVRARRKDGSVFPVELSVGEAETPEGRQFTGVLRDVSSRTEGERRLNELQTDLIRLARVSALDEMGLALAHELNQPLTAIMLYLQAASREMEQEKPDSRASMILDRARKEAERASAIIQRMRQLGEKRAPDRKPCDLNTIVEDAVELTQIGHDRSVRIVRDYEQDLPFVEVDQVQIQQVVVNLMRNAFEALRGSSKAGEIVVSTRLDGRGVLFSVMDNGPGIPPDRLTDLFQAFKTGKRSGMGLGLAISRTIIQSHGGEFLVDPGGGWQGARFVVRLPLRSDDVVADERSRA
jgi:two-component system sensor kinase FixL